MAKPNFKQINDNMEMWYGRFKHEPRLTAYARADGSTPQRGTYDGKIWWEDCSSFVSVLVQGTGQDTRGLPRPNTQGMQSGWLADWGYKKIKTNPDSTFYFKKFDIVVATKPVFAKAADAHTAMIYQSGPGPDALMIHASWPGNVQPNRFGLWDYTYRNEHRTINVWRATSNIFIYSVEPLKN